MPLNIPANLPAIELLRNENIFVMDNKQAESQDIRPLRMLILNLMPLKITTETDLIRLLSNSPLQIEVDFLRLKSHTSKNTPIEHMLEFYISFDEVKNLKYDGMIITGAPVEHLDFEEVNYWGELTEIMNWSRTNVTSTLFICWAAQAGLYHFYDVKKHPLTQKLFGVYEHEVLDKLNPLFRGFDDLFYVPHSRYTEVRESEIEANKELSLVSNSKTAGAYIIMGRGGREIFITGHSEYSPLTLDSEYRRDIAKGMKTAPPENYYSNNDPDKEPTVRWRGHSNLLINNWLNYFVYQKTPYDITTIV